MTQRLMFRKVALVSGWAGVLVAVCAQLYLSLGVLRRPSSASEYRDEFVPLPMQVQGAAAYLHVKYPNSLPRKKEESIEVSPVVFRGAPGATADAGNTLSVDIPESAAQRWEFSFSTESIKVVPKKKSIKTYELTDPIRFHITPTATGSKVLVLHVEFKAPKLATAAQEGRRSEVEPSPEKGKASKRQDSSARSAGTSVERKHTLSRDLRIQVLPRRTALGVDEESVEDVRGVAAVVGLPGLMLLVVTTIRDRRAGSSALPPPRVIPP